MNQAMGSSPLPLTWDSNSNYEVISILAIARCRCEIDQIEFDSSYRGGDEIASIISGLIDATFKEEATSGQSARSIHEEGITYELLDDYTNSQH